MAHKDLVFRLGYFGLQLHPYYYLPIRYVLECINFRSKNNPLENSRAETLNYEIIFNGEKFVLEFENSQKYDKKIVSFLAYYY